MVAIFLAEVVFKNVALIWGCISAVVIEDSKLVNGWSRTAMAGVADAVIIEEINCIQTLRVFHLSYFKYVLQISFNSFQFISSKFWKSVIFNLFEVSFLISNEINFLNKFFSEISMITSIITYSRTTDYLFFILSGKWFHDFWYQLFIYFFILSGKWLLNFWYWNLNILNIFIMWIHSWI